MILDHITVAVSNFDRSKAFYERALQPLGISVLFQFPGGAGLGKGRPQFWINAGAAGAQRAHIAFVAANRAEVDAFYAAAIAAYWTSAQAATPIACLEVADPLAELVRRRVELRVLSSLWPLRDAVVASTLGFSIIRMRNARPRDALLDRV